MLTKKNRVWGIVALLTIAIGFSSCLKNKNDFTPSRPMASIWFMNVSNIAVDPQFYDNDQKVSDSTIYYNFYSRYYVYGGLHKFELRKKGSDSVIVTNTTNYDSTAYYNFLIFGSTPVRALAVKSDFTGVDLNKINIRFLNLSQDAGPVDVYVGNEKIDSNRTMLQNPTSEESTRFKQFTNFSINDRVTIKAAGTETVLANSASLSVGYLNYGAVYTIYLYGSKASTGTDKLGVNAFLSYWQ
ncbi:DUF4397 domain-containing protein [Chitinophaga silvatica]|uniref:DUF4397 domain-containing protein n=1 Tax=Chitinophaga silvatica TaxID=2282649 RepID=A0A3E1Y6P3_9BACT|nr:DUF4397 domain-containing protein [Chitinophaga silvatica]RFS20600.1 DUF4397 domain-containing protein [Chitinophaga silvatica]